MPQRSGLSLLRWFLKWLNTSALPSCRPPVMPAETVDNKRILPRRHLLCDIGLLHWWQTRGCQHVSRLWLSPMSIPLTYDQSSDDGSGSFAETWCLWSEDMVSLKKICAEKTFVCTNSQFSLYKIFFVFIVRMLYLKMNQWGAVFWCLYLCCKF